jgi:hypothetical protein
VLGRPTNPTARRRRAQEFEGSIELGALEPTAASQHAQAPTAVELALEIGDQLEGVGGASRHAPFEKSRQGAPARPTWRKRCKEVANPVQARSSQAGKLSTQVRKQRQGA